MSEGWNWIGEGVQLDPSSQVNHCRLEHVIVGPHCTLSHCMIRGLPDRPVRLQAGVSLWDCVLENTPKDRSFSFGPWRVASTGVEVGEGAHFTQSRLEDAWIGAHVTGHRCVVRASRVGEHCEIRPHGNLILTDAAPHCNLGSEISKSVLEGPGFVSEHTGSYLSLVAPSLYPLRTEAGDEILSPPLPNLTNIGAGTVFANYSGKPKPAASLEASSGSLKGTAVVWGAFTAVNAVVVNRYDQPSVDDDMFALLRRRDITTLGLGCLVERKVTGRIPAFSYANSTSSREIRLGWVLDRQPGILLNILQKMKKRLGANSGALQGLVEGTLRLEIKLLEEERERTMSFFSREQLDRGIATYRAHLDGRWRITDDGSLHTPWRYDERRGRWTPVL